MYLLFWAIFLAIFDRLTEVVDELPNEIVKYVSGVKAQVGNVLKPRQVKDQPKLSWNADPNAFYTIIFSDPDAPSRQNPTRREVMHWLVVNIPGNNLEAGEVKTEFIGTGAPQGTGLHRYIFLVFKQNGKQDFSNVTYIPNTRRTGRISFNTRKFFAEHSIGPLVAYNYYLAEFDDYVPELHAQLKD